MLGGGAPTGRYYQGSAASASTALVSSAGRRGRQRRSLSKRPWTPFATVLTPRADFGLGTDTAQGDGSILDRTTFAGATATDNIFTGLLGAANVPNPNSFGAVCLGYINVPGNGELRVHDPFR